MTKAEAIELLRELSNFVATPPETDEAVNMAIKALEQEPCDKRTDKRTGTHECDCISRQAAIDALKEHRALYCDNTPETFSKLAYVEKGRVDELDSAIATLVNMPTAQLEIITCKDCKHLQKWRSEESAKKFGQIYACARNVFNCPKPEDFCSFAERI